MNQKLLELLIEKMLNNANDSDSDKSANESKESFCWLGEKVIIRTCSAGVHYGELTAKHEDEVILSNARRLYYWKTKNKGISLSEVANHGLDSDSKVCEKVDKIWMKAIEIIPCSAEAIKFIESFDMHRC